MRRLDRKTWRSAFPLRRPPPFPCPHCFWDESGRMRFVSTNFAIEDHTNHLPTTVTMQCDNLECGYVLTAVGTVETQINLESFASDPSLVWEAAEGKSIPYITNMDGDDIPLDDPFFPKVFLPRPPELVETYGAQDGRSGLLILKSFELFWFDLTSCANCLRTIIEATLDNWTVPRADPKGKRANLGYRLDFLQENNEYVADSLRSIKPIGDSGSHGDEVDRGRVLDAFEILNDVNWYLYSSPLSPLDRIKSPADQIYLERLRNQLTALKTRRNRPL